MSGPSASSAARDSAIAALNRSTVALCGADRDAWVQRIAGGTADQDDKALLRWLPGAALKSISMTPTRYVRMVAKMLRAF